MTLEDAWEELHAALPRGFRRSSYVSAAFVLAGVVLSGCEAVDAPRTLIVPIHNDTLQPVALVVTEDEPPFRRLAGFDAPAIVLPGSRANVAIRVPAGEDWTLAVERQGEEPAIVFWGPHLARCAGTLAVDVNVSHDGVGWASRGPWCGDP